MELVNGLGSVGNTELRAGIYYKFKKLGYSFCQVIHPTAILAKDCILGEGVQVMAGVVVNTGTRIAADSIINTGAVVDHDCVIGSHVHIAPGATLSGGVHVGDGSHIGTGATVIQGVSIGSRSGWPEGCAVRGQSGRNTGQRNVTRHKIPHHKSCEVFYMKIGYFADGPWGHRAFEKIVADNSLRIVFLTVRYDKKDSVLVKMADKQGIPVIIHQNINTPEARAEYARFGAD